MKTLIPVFFILLTSCAMLEKTPKTMEIYGAGIIQNPVLVDLDVCETRISGSAAGGVGTSLESLKLHAVINALTTSDADILVEPKFESETTEGETTVTVTGFPANYKNFRSLKAEDVHLLQLGLTQKLPVYEPPKAEKKNKAGVVLGMILLSLIGITLILSI